MLHYVKYFYIIRTLLKQFFFFLDKRSPLCREHYFCDIERLLLLIVRKVFLMYFFLFHETRQKYIKGAV